MAQKTKTENGTKPNLRDTVSSDRLINEHVRLAQSPEKERDLKGKSDHEVVVQRNGMRALSGRHRDLSLSARCAKIPPLGFNY